MQTRNLASLALPLVFLGILATSLFAQESSLPAISPDRPSIGTGPDIVPLHSLQAESGLNVLYSSSSLVTDLPESLLRFGISQRAELRFGSSNAVWNPSPDPGTHRLQSQDISLGSKVALTLPNHLPPQAVLLTFTCPTGGPSYSSNSFDPTGIFIWEQAAPKGFILTENIGAAYTSTNGVRHTNWSPGISVSRNLAKATAWFAEYAPTASRAQALLEIVDGGLSYSPRSTSQFDLRVGVEHDSTGTHQLLSVGYSHRLDGLKRRFGQR